MTALTIKKLKDEKLDRIILKKEDLLGLVIAENYQDNESELLSVGDKLTDENIDKIDTINI